MRKIAQKATEADDIFNLADEEACRRLMVFLHGHDGEALMKESRVRMQEGPIPPHLSRRFDEMIANAKRSQGDDKATSAGPIVEQEGERRPKLRRAGFLVAALVVVTSTFCFSSQVCEAGLPVCVSGSELVRDAKARLRASLQLTSYAICKQATSLLGGCPEVLRTTYTSSDSSISSAALRMPISTIKYWE